MPRQQQVVRYGAFEGGIFILPKVELPGQALVGGARSKPGRPSCMPPSWKTQAVDQRLRFRQAEEARLWVARLRQRGYRADLDVPEPETGQAAPGSAIFIIASRQPDGIRKGEPES